jgi:hypothetical protein
MAYDPTQEYVIPEPTTAELETLVSQLSMLDPNHEGVNMSQLRVFYPKIGWGHIQKRLEALAASGRVVRSQRNKGGSVLFDYWTVSS